MIEEKRGDSNEHAAALMRCSTVLFARNVNGTCVVHKKPHRNDQKVRERQGKRENMKREFTKEERRHKHLC